MKHTPLRIAAMYRTSARWRAWRNVLVSATNEGLRLGLFSMQPGDNRWPVKDDGRNPGAVFTFALPDGTPAVGYVNDAGWDELKVHCAANPTQDGPDHVRDFNAAFRAGEAFVAGWVERRKGTWLQVPHACGLKCRRELLAPLAALQIEPVGYADHGRFML
jgi:hypothetical protein